MSTIYNQGTIGLTEQELSSVYDLTYNIIENLPHDAIEELLSGNGNDLDKLLKDVMYETNNVINNDIYGIRDFGSLSAFEQSFDDTLKIQSYNYFKTTMLPNFTQGWRNVEIGNLVQLWPYSVYICSRDTGKCQSPDTEVVMFDGTLRISDEVKVGDQLMGPDSTSRTILTIHTGIDDMYKINQNRTQSYTINSKHELIFKKKDAKGQFSIMKMDSSDFHLKKKKFKNTSFGIRIKGWELPDKMLPLEPYYLGIWISEGKRSSQQICNPDIEVIDYLKGYADRVGLKLSKNKENNRHNIHGVNGHKNIILDNLRLLNILYNKHIPDVYLKSSRSQRLELLAGLIDGDGAMNSSGKSFIFSQVNLNTIEQVQKLCWSLGFRANIRTTVAKNKFSKWKKFTTYNLGISGDVWEIPTKIQRKKIYESKKPYDFQLSSLSTESLGKGKYVGFTVDKDNLFLLKDGTIIHNSYEGCFALPLWRLYRYTRPGYFQRDTADNKNSKETVIITNESKLGKLHLEKIAEEIQLNDLLKEKLFPDGRRNGIGKEKIYAKNGATVDLRTLGSFKRGLHVGMIIVDDFLDDSCLYSREQRQKIITVFKTEIQPMVNPQGGSLLVFGTPFAQDDLYSELKKDPMFKVFEYPCIDIQGNILAPERHSFKFLMDRKKSLGSIMFSREYLVTPVSDSSTIFPYDYLMTSIIGMENVSLAYNIDSYPIKLKRVVAGVDFAISGNVGADSTVISVWGADENDNYYLIYIETGQGWSHDEQVSRIVRIDNAFKPNKIYVEDNGFQRIMGRIAKQRGTKTIEGFITDEKLKKNWMDGLPSLSAIFERGEIKIPYKEGWSKDMADLIFGQFNSIGFNPDSGKLQAISGHDDLVMSCFFCIHKLRTKKGLKVSFIDG